MVRTEALPLSAKDQRSLIASSRGLLILDSILWFHHYVPCDPPLLSKSCLRVSNAGAHSSSIIKCENRTSQHQIKGMHPSEGNSRGERADNRGQIVEISKTVTHSTWKPRLSSEMNQWRSTGSCGWEHVVFPGSRKKCMWVDCIHNPPQFTSTHFQPGQTFAAHIRNIWL